MIQLQGKKINLFQPAAEFLPMINEVDTAIMNHFSIFFLYCDVMSWLTHVCAGT
jgi:hypothetical protein